MTIINVPVQTAVTQDAGPGWLTVFIWVQPTIIGSLMYPVPSGLHTKIRYSVHTATRLAVLRGGSAGTPTVVQISSSQVLLTNVDGRICPDARGIDTVVRTRIDRKPTIAALTPAEIFITLFPSRFFSIGAAGEHNSSIGN